MEKLLSTSEAAEALGISIRRVVELIAEGKLTATKKGRDWLIHQSALAGVKVYGKAGRPPKTPPATRSKAAAKTKAAKAAKPAAKAKPARRRPDRRAR